MKGYLRSNRSNPVNNWEHPMKPDSILHSSSGRPTENPSRGPTNRRRFDRLAHERVKLSRPSRQNGTKKNSLPTGARRFAASCSDQLMGPLRLLSDIRRRRHAPPSSTARDVQVTARHDSFVASFCFVLFCFVLRAKSRNTVWSPLPRFAAWLGKTH